MMHAPVLQARPSSLNMFILHTYPSTQLKAAPGQGFDEPGIMLPSRQAAMGTAARPGTFLNATSAEQSEAQQQQVYANLPEAAKLQVLPSS